MSVSMGVSAGALCAILTVISIPARRTGTNHDRMLEIGSMVIIGGGG